MSSALPLRLGVTAQPDPIPIMTSVALLVVPIGLATPPLTEPGAGNCAAGIVAQASSDDPAVLPKQAALCRVELFGPTTELTLMQARTAAKLASIWSASAIVLLTKTLGTVQAHAEPMPRHSTKRVAAVIVVNRCSIGFSIPDRRASPRAGVAVGYLP